MKSLSNDNKLLLATDDGTFYKIVVYNIVEESDIYTLSLAKEDIFPVDVVINDNYLVTFYKDIDLNIFQVRIDNLDDLTTELISLDSSKYPSENTLTLVENNLLINLENQNEDTGYTYLLDILSDDEELILISEYAISTHVLDATKEYVYGGKNTIVDDLIVMASIDYILDNNGVGIYSAEDGELLYNTNEFYDESCSVSGPYVYNSYVSVKTTCNGNNQIYVFDINDKNSKTKIDFLYGVDDYKVKGINQEYIVITNVNYDEQNPRILYSRIDKNDIKEVPLPPEETSFYGVSIYMLEEFLVIYTTDYKIYNYDLKEEVYREVEYFDGNTYCLGFIEQFLLFGDDLYVYGYDVLENRASGSFEEDDSLFAYHLGDSFYVDIFRDRIDVYKTMINNPQ